MLNSKSILRTIVFCSIMVICVITLNFLLVPLSSLQKKFINYHKALEKNIDIVVIGSSQEGDSVIPEVLNSTTGLNSFVFAPQGGFPESSYMLLLDVAEKNNVKIAVIGWDLLQNFKYPRYIYPHREELYREFITDMKGNKELEKLVLKGIAEQRYTVSFFNYASFPENLTNIPAVLKSKYSKTESESINSKPIDTNKLTVKGDPYNYKKVLSDSYINSISDDDMFYMKKIKDFTKEKNILLYVLCCPLPDCVISQVKELKSIQETSKQFFSDLGIPYIDGFDQATFPNSTENTNFKDCYGHIISPYSKFYTESMANYIMNDSKNMIF